MLCLVALSLVADPIAEHFRRNRPHTGWKRFRPPHEISALLLDSSDLWAGGRDGLSRFDWKRRALLPLPAGTPALKRVRSLGMDRDGTLWVGHGGGVECRTRGSWSHLASAVGAVQAVLQRSNGEIWVGGELGLARWQNGSFRLLRDSKGLGFEGVDALFEDRDGNLWVSSASALHGGLARLNGQGQWEDFTHAAGLAHPAVAAMMQDREGALWFASGFGNRGGACRMQDGDWSCLGQKDGLTADRTRFVFQERAGEFWISSETAGLAVQRGRRWVILTPDQGMTGWEVKQILEAPDQVFWLATEDGVTAIGGEASELAKGPQL